MGWQGAALVSLVREQVEIKQRACVLYELGVDDAA